MDSYKSAKNNNSKRLHDPDADITKRIEVLNMKSIEELLGATYFGRQKFVSRNSLSNGACQQKFPAIRKASFGLTS